MPLTRMQGEYLANCTHRYNVKCGATGSGKSTLLALLPRFYDATAGEVFVDGRDVRKYALHALRGKMAIVLQKTELFSMTIGENIAWGMDAASDEEIRRAAKIAQAADFIERQPEGYGTEVTEGGTSLSGGQRQRVGIARALIMNPKLIIADECISALDVSIQAQVVNLMKDIQQETGTAYLFIAHDLSMVKYISDRIGVLHLGHLLETGTTEEIFENPIHPYTRSLISAIPVADPVTARQSHRIVLQGDVPSPLNPPSGCRFRTRCPYADERCAAEVPEFKEVSSGHWAACHHLDKVK